MRNLHPATTQTNDDDKTVKVQFKMSIGWSSFIIFASISILSGASRVTSEGNGAANVNTPLGNLKPADKQITRESNGTILLNESQEENKEPSLDLEEIAAQLFNATDVLNDDPSEEIQKVEQIDTSDWSYDEQDKWFETYPACSGLFQSPVNIRNRYVTDRMTSTCLKWLNYNVSHSGISVLRVDNTVELEIKPSSVPTIRGGPLTGDYKLAGIRWHWGFDDFDGSEHAINSRKHPLEMHAIHHSTKYTDINQALVSHGDREAVLIVAVIYKSAFRSSAATATVTKVIEQGATAGDAILLSDLGLGFKNNYYTYLGSLTSPPCSPLVRWLVSETIQRIRPQQMTAFRSLTKGTARLFDTFRKSQSIENRDVDHFKTC